MNALIMATLLLFAGSTWAATPERVDLPALWGKSRTEVADAFPGSSVRLKNWRGWETAYLEFIDGDFASLHLERTDPMPGREVIRFIIEELNVDLAKSEFRTTPLFLEYAIADGPVSTVRLFRAPGELSGTHSIGILIKAAK